MNDRRFFYLVIITFATLMVWVVLDIIHANSKIQIPDEVQQLIEPINPQFDQEAIEEL